MNQEKHVKPGGARGGVLGRDGVGRQLQGCHHPHRPHGDEEVRPHSTYTLIPTKPQIPQPAALNHRHHLDQADGDSEAQCRG